MEVGTEGMVCRRRGLEGVLERVVCAVEKNRRWKEERFIGDNGL